MTGSVLTLGATSFPYLLVAAFMVLADLYIVLRLLPRGGGTPHLGTVILVVGLLLMSIGLWLSVIYAILSPGDASIVSVFIAGNSMMAVVGLWTIGLLYHAEEKRLPAEGWRWPLLFAGLILGSELLMGITYALAQNGPASYSAEGYAGLAALLSDAGTSVWFLYAMLATMLAVIAWLPLPTPERRALVTFSATTLVAPLVLSSPLAGAVAMGLVMAAVLGVLLVGLLGDAAASAAFGRLAIALSLALGLMAVGVLVALSAPGSVAGESTFASAMLFVMGGELWVLIRWGFEGRTSSPAGPLPRTNLSNASASPEL